MPAGGVGLPAADGVRPPELRCRLCQLRCRLSCTHLKILIEYFYSNLFCHPISTNQSVVGGGGAGCALGGSNRGAARAASPASLGQAS